MSQGERDAADGDLSATAAVVGLAGTALSAKERELFEERQPLGFILFARNCESPAQLSALIEDLLSTVAPRQAPILIDQEGGRVRRLKPPHWREMPPLRHIGELAAQDLEAAIEAAWLHARLIAAELEPLGITINCSPVLDLGLPEQTHAIGYRAFSSDPGNVAKLGKATIEGYLSGGFLPVIKNLPGHGRATVDSHKDLPCVQADRSLLAAADWLPFKDNADAPLGMTAHILFPELDPTACATQSKTIIDEVIRGEIGFKGALFSDDLSMEALGGTLGERAARARKAGCDLALHCNGDFDEMQAVLAASGLLEGPSRSRVEHALAERWAPEPFDMAYGEARLRSLLDGREPLSRAIG
ncbi:MAG: beta-N-acetylhexosaminidase [Pseudomonadota bacterium]